MNKKTSIILSILIISFTGLVMLIKHSNLDSKNSYGVKIIQQDPQTIILADTISSLQESLPVRQSNFIISNYDYSQAKFIVTYQGNMLSTEEIQNTFYSWLQKSEYSHLPPARFSFQPLLY